MKKICWLTLAALLCCTSAQAGDHSFGDSVTRYIAATDVAHGYVSLLSTATARAITNHGIDGDMVPDAMNKVYGVNLAASERATIMLGINDDRIYCPSPCASPDATKIGYYRRGLQAEVAWLALFAKQTARTSGSYTGTWGNTPVNSIGKSSNTNGSTASFTVSGSVVYVGMLQQDSAPGTFNVLIDGIVVELAGTTQTSGLGPTVNGVTYGPMLKRYPGLSVGLHTVQIVVISASGGGNYVYVDWVAGNDQGAKPAVYVGNVLRGSAYAGGSDISVAAENVQVAGLIAELQADLLNVVAVDASGAINQTTDMEVNGRHPVNAGHAKIESVFYAAETGPPPPPPTYSPAVIEMDAAGNFFGRLSTDSAGTTRKQLN